MLLETSSKLTPQKMVDAVLNLDREFVASDGVLHCTSCQRVVARSPDWKIEPGKFVATEDNLKDALMHVCSIKKYLVYGGWVVSQKDWQEHYVPAHRVPGLYNVNPDECVFSGHSWPPGLQKTLLSPEETRDLIYLYPRSDGNYTIPVLDNQRPM